MYYLWTGKICIFITATNFPDKFSDWHAPAQAVPSFCQVRLHTLSGFPSSPQPDGMEWLDEYFSGKEPDFTPTLHPMGSPFRQAVWKLFLQIPYGQTTTYGEIARQLEKLQNRPHMSAQAVGGAVETNFVFFSLTIPLKKQKRNCSNSPAFPKHSHAEEGSSNFIFLLDMRNIRPLHPVFHSSCAVQMQLSMK